MNDDKSAQSFPNKKLTNLRSSSKNKDVILHKEFQRIFSNMVIFSGVLYRGLVSSSVEQSIQCYNNQE